MVMAMTAALVGCGNKSAEDGDAKESTDAAGAVYKVGIIQYVDDASLNQIVTNLESQLDELSKEKGVTFEYEDYYYNGQADSTTINQIVAELINDDVDILVPIATPTAMICQSATEDNQIPVVFRKLPEQIFITDEERIIPFTIKKIIKNRFYEPKFICSSLSRTIRKHIIEQHPKSIFVYRLFPECPGSLLPSC